MTAALISLLRRLLSAILLVLVVSSGAFLLARLAPGDFSAELFGTGVSRETVARERARLGLDRPALAQYGDWLARAARLDFGTSIMYRRPVGELVRRRAANTAILALSALALATIVGIPLGVVAGGHPLGFGALVIRGVTVVALSLPSLVTSLVLVLVAARTGWFPIGGMVSAGVSDAPWGAWLADLAWHLPVPVVALAVPVAALLGQIQAQALAETMNQPFVTAARARGVPASRLVWRDGLRPAVKPVAALYGLVFAGLLSGSFAVEIVTSWPGLGRLMFDALRARDLYLVAGCASAGAVFLAIGSLLSDVLLAAADPRLRRANTA